MSEEQNNQDTYTSEKEDDEDIDNPEIKNMSQGEFRVWTKMKFDNMHEKIEGIEDDVDKIDKRLWAVLASVIISILLMLLRFYLGA